MCVAQLRRYIIRGCRRRGPPGTVLTVGDLEPSMQTGLGDAEVLRDLTERCFTLAGYSDDVGSELGRKCLGLDPGMWTRDLCYATLGSVAGMWILS